MSYLVSAKPLSPFGVEPGGVGALPGGWVTVTPPLAWAEGLLTQGHPPFSSSSSAHLRLRGSRGPGKQEQEEQEEVGRSRGAETKEKEEEEEGGTEEEEGWQERRRRDGGGAVHLQIKFVIQASDGPTARD